MSDIKYERVPGATHVVELRLRTGSSNFEIVNRHRILSWRKDKQGRELPVTQHGPVSHHAFWPSEHRPEDGACFVEVRRADGTRGWAVPWEIARVGDDARVKEWLRYYIEGTRAYHGGATPPQAGGDHPAQPAQRSFADLPPEERGAHVAHMRATQARSQRGGGGVTAQRRELEALKRRLDK